ncbi:TIGR02757 family protein [Riemerella anatipestifer]|uniref:TIGR02757 family protein n=1 Tax=Riemerella anatipestifer TaxID=34085 RepID=UPI0021F84987|nr:TIGR02757 family protein [Riemerella anatipestifer]MCW0485195.1 TIGR02757 family protein [Riemerella anatipestifer]
MDSNELKDFLNEKADLYNHPNFIEQDPIQIPHRFSLKQDIEISGFIAATIAWGNRKSIIKSANHIMELMGQSPLDFVLNHTDKDLDKIGTRAIHRTFNSKDLIYFIQRFRHLYQSHSSMEELLLPQDGETNFYHALERFRNAFLDTTTQHRSHKHISSTYKKSAAKRLMMFLRWMVRKDNKGVDFGIWEQLDPALLSIPLDVHTGNIARQLQLITRTQNDWKTVEELDHTIRKWDAKDPAKYDFALFGLSVSGEFKQG